MGPSPIDRIIFQTHPLRFRARLSPMSIVWLAVKRMRASRVTHNPSYRHPPMRHKHKREQSNNTSSNSPSRGDKRQREIREHQGTHPMRMISNQGKGIFFPRTFHRLILVVGSTSSDSRSSNGSLHLYQADHCTCQPIVIHCSFNFVSSTHRIPRRLCASSTTNILNKHSVVASTLSQQESVAFGLRVKRGVPNLRANKFDGALVCLRYHAS